MGRRAIEHVRKPPAPPSFRMLLASPLTNLPRRMNIRFVGSGAGLYHWSQESSVCGRKRNKRRGYPHLHRRLLYSASGNQFEPSHIALPQTSPLGNG